MNLGTGGKQIKKTRVGDMVDGDVPIGPFPGGGQIKADNKVYPLWVSPPKRLQRSRVETMGINLALDRQQVLAPPRPDDEINLVLLLIAPEKNLLPRKPGEELIEDKMFEEVPAVFAA